MLVVFLNSNFLFFFIGLTLVLVEVALPLNNWDDCDGKPIGNLSGLIPRAVKTGSSVVEAGILWTEYLEFGKWHRSKERKAGDHTFISFMLNKKWTMEEEFNNHEMRFQQVTLSNRE